MTDQEKAKELDEAALDEVTGGAGTKALVGDDAGILRGPNKTKGFGETTGESPNTF